MTTLVLLATEADISRFWHGVLAGLFFVAAVVVYKINKKYDHIEDNPDGEEKAP